MHPVPRAIAVPALTLIALAPVTLASAADASSPPASARTAGMPVPGPVIAEFDPPDPDWLPGHRGIDLEARPGDGVRTPRTGVVEFAGMVAGTPLVVVSHGAVRATYLPVTAVVGVGSAVAEGDRIGVVVADHTHCATTCLHWGARANGRYVDPRLLLGQVRVVLTSLPD